MITKTPLLFPLVLGDDVDVNMQPDSTQPPHWVPAWIVALEQITGPDEVFGVPVSHINPLDRGGSAYWIAKVTTHDQSSTVWAHKQDLRTAIPDSRREAEEDIATLTAALDALLERELDQCEIGTLTTPPTGDDGAI